MNGFMVAAGGALPAIAVWLKSGGHCPPYVKPHGAGRKRDRLGFFEELRFERHGHAVYFTVNVMVAVYDADAFDFRAFFDHDG